MRYIVSFIVAGRWEEVRLDYDFDEEAIMGKMLQTKSDAGGWLISALEKENCWRLLILSCCIAYTFKGK